MQVLQRSRMVRLPGRSGRVVRPSQEPPQGDVPDSHASTGLAAPAPPSAHTWKSCRRRCAARRKTSGRPVSSGRRPCSRRRGKSLMRSKLLLNPRIHDLTAVILVFGALFVVTGRASPSQVASDQPPKGAAADNHRPRPNATGAESCHLPVAATCPKGKCGTYRQAVAEVQEFGRQMTSFCLKADVGRCGALRYVSMSGGFSWSTEFFDASGKLVAAEQGTDMIGPPCFGKRTFGTKVPKCDMTVEESFCPRPPPPRSPR
jgi:hypothetical protein